MKSSRRVFLASVWRTKGPFGEKTPTHTLLYFGVYLSSISRISWIKLHIWDHFVQNHASTRSHKAKERVQSHNNVLFCCPKCCEPRKWSLPLMSMIQEGPWPSKNSNRTNTNLIHYWWQCGHAFISLSTWRWVVSSSSPAVGRMILFFLGDASAGDTLGNTRNLGVAIQFQFQITYCSILWCFSWSVSVNTLKQQH